MNQFELEVKSDKGPLRIQWSDVDTLAKYANVQSGCYLQNKENNLSLHLEYFKSWNQTFWLQRQQQGIFNLPNNATILDIGSGVSIVDLLLYSYLPNSKFYLVDKNSWEMDFVNTMTPTVFYDDSYPSYNSWSPVLDAIETSKFDRSRFVIQSPEEKFPEQVDAVTSYFSWCFHYPKEVYWDRAVRSLKFGGKLVLDVRLIVDRDIIGEISEELKSEPVTFPFPELPKYVDAYPTAVDGVSGYRCMWVKNKHD